MASQAEECLFAGVVGGTGPDVLLGAVHDLRAVRSAGAIGLLAAHSRFVRVFGGVLQGQREMCKHSPNKVFLKS